MATNSTSTLSYDEKGANVRHEETGETKKPAIQIEDEFEIA